MHKSAEVLNSLITINNDRIQGYETAFDETKDADLKSLFTQFIQTSKNAKRELEAEVIQLGEKPDDGTRLDGKIYRVWMDFKAAITGKDREGILNSCEYGEDVALNTYKDALEEDHVDSKYIPMIESQRDRIKMEHDRVKNLRDIATVKS